MPLELNHSSYIYTAVSEFTTRNNIEFKVSSKNQNLRGKYTITMDTTVHSKHYFSKVTLMEVILTNDEVVRIAFDMDDDAFVFSSSALEWSDHYFKRSLRQSVIDVFESNKKYKITAMGLPFKVKPDKLKHINKIILLFVIFKIKELLKIDRTFFRRIKLFHRKTILQLRGFLNTRKLQDFQEYRPIDSDRIFYQKRLFEDIQLSDTVDVNGQRVAILRLLSSHFPTNFYGGLQKNGIAIREYPDLISDSIKDEVSFLEIMNKCGICVYTRGLKQSSGWTLSEFLSQGKCIIAEKIYNVIPFQLINGEQLLYFETEEELLQICKELLNNTEKRKNLGSNARSYYERYVSPVTFVENLLSSL